LDDDNPQLVVWAAYASTMLGDDRFDVIAAALQAQDVDVRRSGILALRQLGDRRAIEPLRGLRGDQRRRFPGDSTVEEAAANALFSLGYDGAL
jgi:HEAT repeat protein